MTQMNPEDIGGYDKATEGEKRVFRFLREAARPEKDYLCWYEPSIGAAGVEPDFILFVRRLGVLVLEVKDRTRRQTLAIPIPGLPLGWEIGSIPVGNCTTVASSAELDKENALPRPEAFAGDEGRRLEAAIPPDPK